MALMLGLMGVSSSPSSPSSPLLMFPLAVGDFEVLEGVLSTSIEVVGVASFSVETEEDEFSSECCAGVDGGSVFSTTLGAGDSFSS